MSDRGKAERCSGRNFYALSNTCVSFFLMSMYSVFTLGFKKRQTVKLQDFMIFLCHISGDTDTIKLLIFVNCLICPFKFLTLVLLVCHVRYPQQSSREERADHWKFWKTFCAVKSYISGLLGTMPNDWNFLNCYRYQGYWCKHAINKT